MERSCRTGFGAAHEREEAFAGGEFPGLRLFGDGDVDAFSGFGVGLVARPETCGDEVVTIDLNHFRRKMCEQMSMSLCENDWEAIVASNLGTLSFKLTSFKQHAPLQSTSNVECLQM